MAHDPLSGLTVLVTGATGIIGTALTAALEARGSRVFRLTRSPKQERDIAWDPAAGRIDLSSLPALDAVVHLASENLAARRWTRAQKRRIFDSRATGTRLVAGCLASLDPAPCVLISASGAHIYRGGVSGRQDERAPVGGSFLARVSEAWEAATKPAEGAGIRVVRLRLGLVLSPSGGALGKLLPVFRLGLGGRLGSGRQRMNWIALDDVLGIISKAIVDEHYRGPINAVAPQTVTNAEFTRALAAALHRPAIFPVPAALLRLALGELADETLLSDISADPARLRELGYVFRHPELAGALAAVLEEEVVGRR